MEPLTSPIDEPENTVEVTAVLKPIIREHTEEFDVMIEEPPFRSEVIDVAVNSRIERDVAEETLERSIELNRVGCDKNNKVWIK